MCTLLEINGITLIKKWYNPVASWYTIYGITKKKQMLYHIICDIIPFNVIVWYNSYFHMLYHIIHNVIPLFLTVYTVPIGHTVAELMNTVTF